MVHPDEWFAVAQGLIERNICTVFHEEDLFHLGDQVLLNGMFSVSKQEVVDGIELCRLIMNLKPLNSNCRPLVGDTPTLPSATSLGSIFLDQDELLTTSSEDIKCFFYLFKVPSPWLKYLGFGREVPRELLPADFGPGKGYLVSQVLPMGFINSVAIAQHIHRNVVRKCLGSLRPPIGGEAEIRRDRVASSSSTLFRIYLDNFDELKRVDRQTAELIQGQPSREVEALREAYAQEGLPRHPKKAVEQALAAEVQGAWVDGEAGMVYAKMGKIAKYIALILQVLQVGWASQKELQVIGGGMVYIAMFKRPLLCGLNQIWRQIVHLEGQPRWKRAPLRREVALELVRFLWLLPLAFMSLRSGADAKVTASDASSSGGGVCVTRGLTPYGWAANFSYVRGDVPEEHDFCQVLSIGLFDGISALRVALDALGLPMAGHISVEKDASARRVVESFFPDTVFVEDIEEVSEEMVKQWSLRFSGVSVVIIGSGPPCQGVSGLNADRRGALRDLHSCLFSHVPRVSGMCRRHFPWAQIHTLTENVASMDYQDCQVMNEAFEEQPWFVDATGISLSRRPRLYWLSWELLEGEGATFGWGSDGTLPIKGEVALQATLDSPKYLEAGWSCASPPLPTFTTSRPSSTPHRRPAGLKGCQEHELERWREHKHRYPPYQYRDSNCLWHAREGFRPPSVTEREAILGFPIGYTTQCLPKALHGTESHSDCRLSLLGNSWSVPVVCWLLSCLFHILGFIPRIGVQQIVDRLAPGQAATLQGLLLRPPMTWSTRTLPGSNLLVKKLCGLVSLKGEDLLVQHHTDVPVKYHRLRLSVPAKLWRWQTVTGWKWTGEPEHINVLELRATLTAMRWRVERLHQMDIRCIHLVDSLVVLHALSRGRSSSRKMRRTLMRLNSYLLASGLHPTWGYVDTHQNPADRPSRRGVKKKWLKRPPK